MPLLLPMLRSRAVQRVDAQGGNDGGAQTAARIEILRLHRTLFEKQRALIRARVHGYDAAFRRYERRYQRAVRTFERVASFDEVVEDAAASDVVHVGDYHTLKQAQRGYMKLVRRLAEGGRPIVLALEFVEARHQAALDRYLAGRMSERRFLQKIRSPGSHPFDVWPHFRPIFEMARELGLPLVALEKAGRGTLAERDRFWARRIARALQERPGAIVMTLAGQLHCTPGHLPARVADAMKKTTQPPRQLVVFQNAEPIYFELERQGIEHQVEAVRVGTGAWNLVNTSPLVAQQSFLDWVEGDADAVETSQPEQHFKELARLVAGFLALDVGDALEQVEVYTAGDLSFLAKLRADGHFSARDVALIRRRILSRESCYIPRARIAYLANLSINHAAEEACHFLRHAVTGHDEPGHGLVDAFYGRALEEAFAFFGSRIVNPRRKAPTVEAMHRMRRSGSPGERRVAAIVLGHLAFERGQRARPVRGVYDSPDVDVFNAVTHVLGYMLGSRLYDALLAGQLSKDEARELFLDPLDEDGDAMHRYFELARRFGAKARSATTEQKTP